MPGANPTAIGSVVPIWTVAPGGAGPVDSVFGRLGAVVAVSGDYLASQIVNDSAVPGASVADALNKLGNTPQAFVYAAGISLDVSTANFFQQTDSMTGDTVLTLTNGVDGDEGTACFAQDAVGGHKITNVIAAGRTIRMQEGLVSLNTAAFIVASAKGYFSYRYATIDGTAYLLIGMVGDQAPSFA